MNLATYLHAGYPGIAIITAEETRAESLNESDPAFADLLARSATLATLDLNRQSLLNQ